MHLSDLLAQVEHAVVEAQRSVATQHMEDIARFFEPAPNQDPGLTFPGGSWLPRTVEVTLPPDTRRAGPLAPPAQTAPRTVKLPLIALVPLRSYAIDQFELLTQLRLAWSDVPPSEHTEAAIGVDTQHGKTQLAEVKIVMRAHEPPQALVRIVQAGEKLLDPLSEHGVSR
jgi:hypothetical protein